MKKQYKALFFDLDRTLLDFSASEKKGLHTIFAAHHIPFTDEMLSYYLQENEKLWSAYEKGEIAKDTIFQKRFPKLVSHFGLCLDGLKLEAAYRKTLENGFDMIDGALELVQTLYKKYELYVVTNGLQSTQYKRLHATGLAPYFQKVFVSEEIGYQKPNKSYFDYCFHALPHLSPKDVLIIGDSLSSDILGGNLYGIDTCLMNAEHLPNNTNILPLYEIHHLFELYDILA